MYPPYNGPSIRHATMTKFRASDASEAEVNAFSRHILTSTVADAFYFRLVQGDLGILLINISGIEYVQNVWAFSQKSTISRKKPVIPDKCTSITATSPEVDCACPSDPALSELGPRKDTVCKPSTGKDATESIRAILNLIVTVILIPALANIF
ncbi:MAG: hypothetical protein EZS28_031606 [Streblomastix strix]|uniref:Uncharacterized protein n=1 Tax=Streblomastix strix TaxID=222440 RepID=A0A5J4UQZ6_9EUKA|nr:MAG: hypothetical protein EZS28_031606 [Streblomastix strix]